jgi:hypothetical protein
LVIGLLARASSAIVLLTNHPPNTAACLAGIELSVKLSRVFRAHWEDESVHTNQDEAAVFGDRAAMAREGLSMVRPARRPTPRIIAYACISLCASLPGLEHVAV